MVVQDGVPQVGILCTENPTPQDKKAATELQRWLKEITGATLPINYGGAPGKQIVLRTEPGLGEEGYSIKSKPQALLLWGGRKRGPINAVYALLEEDIGCRFYTKEFFRVPKTNTLILAPVERRYVPALKLRDPFYACAFDADWSLRNRTTAPRALIPEEYGGHMDYDGMFVHTAARIVPPAKYMDAHPEYFAQRKQGGANPEQLCATHPQVAKLAISYVREVLTKNTNTEIVSVSRNDNPAMCYCERCVKLREAEGSEMADQLVLVNAVAEALEKEFPQLTVDTLAYGRTHDVPKTMRPRKNVAIRLCNDTEGAWRYPFTPAEQCDTAKLAKAWAAVHDRIYVWDYDANFSHYLAPMPNLDVIAANIRFWTQNKAEGVMLQGAYQGPGDQDELKAWAAAKLLWNPAWDEKALTRDFIWGYYGKAAPALLEYQELLDKMQADFKEQMASPRGGIRYPMDSVFLTKDFVEKATAVFARARELAREDEPLLFRVERAELPVLYVQCARGPEFWSDHYVQAVADFERIGRREKVQRLREGKPNFEAKLAEFKKRKETKGSQKPGE